jgi:steroid delta-isomerase-like uncharacterized protein
VQNINHLADVLPSCPPARWRHRPIRHDGPPEGNFVMTAKTNAESVRRALDAAWNRGDLDPLAHLTAPDHRDQERDGVEIGWEHVAESIRAYRAAFPDVRMSFDQQISADNHVVTRWTASGTHQGELAGIAATGRVAAVTGIFIHRISSGRIAETWTSFDELGLLRQIGVIPAAAAAG